MRLIDADKFKAYMQGKYIIFDNTLADIDAQPTVDAVEVVRCKDCKYYDDENHFCSYVIWANPDGYCSGGERRKDETN